MAEMIPETLNSSDSATNGEKRVFRLLRDALQPDEDFLVWFEPKAIKKRPDFLVWSHELGLLVIEVKDWVIGQIRSMTPNQWQIERRPGIVALCDSPIEQARKCFIQFKQLFEKSGSLCHNNPTKPGRLRFPIGYSAIFTNITRGEAAQQGILSVLNSTFCFFADDLTVDVTDRNARRVFTSKLKSAFTHWFAFEPISREEFKLLRFLIFPEIRVKNVRTLRSSEDSGLIKTLDLEQEKVAKSIPEGHRVLKGVAGSGKSLVLSCRAKYLAKLHSDWRILVVCYGISFSQYLRQLITAAEPHGNNANIEVLHYHDLVKKLTGENLQKRREESREQWDARVGTILLNAIALERITLRYAAILIDEGQDFTVEWLQSLTSLLNAETDSLLLCLDPAQNIFGRRIPYKSAGIKVQGKRPVLLKRSYRNTVEILELARTFSKAPSEISTAVNHDDNLDDALFPMHTDRHGELPTVVENILPDNQIEFVLDEVQQYVKSGKCSWCDIAVLYASPPSSSFVPRFCSQFSKRFGTNRLYWVTENREAKLALDVTSETVKLSTIESIKGMEFSVVFLLGLEQLPRSDRDLESERNLAYVGITRAQDILYVLGSARTGYFQEIVSVLGNSTAGAPVAECPPEKSPSLVLNEASLSLTQLSEEQSRASSVKTTSVLTEATANVAITNNLSTDTRPPRGVASYSPRLNRNQRQRRHVRLSQSGEAGTTIDYVGLYSSPFAQVYQEIARCPYCVTAIQAEQIADKAMAALGLTTKTSLPQKFNNEREFTYEDPARFLTMKVSIWARPKKQSDYKSPASVRETLYWLFNCRATRGDVLLCRSRGEDCWRDSPAVFAEDAWQFVSDLSSVQVEAEGRFLGELIFWNEKGAYGFLAVPGIGELFLHKTAVRPSDQRCLQVGQWFSFRLTESDRKTGSLMAIEVEYRTNPQKAIPAQHN